MLAHGCAVKYLYWTFALLGSLVRIGLRPTSAGCALGAVRAGLRSSGCAGGSRGGASRFRWGARACVGSVRVALAVACRLAKVQRALALTLLHRAARHVRQRSAWAEGERYGAEVRERVACESYPGLNEQLHAAEGAARYH